MATTYKSQQQRLANNAAPTEQHFVWPFTIAEFQFVRNNFMSDRVDTLEQIYEMVKMWLWRWNDDSPIIVLDLTKLVIQGLIFDYRYVRDKLTQMPYAEENASLIYGTVLARFVNYIDQVYKTYSGAHSNTREQYHVELALARRIWLRDDMANSAQNMEFPSWIVQIRHDVVHKAMPTLQKLRESINYCRDWLHKVHWSQSMEIALISLGTPFEAPPSRNVALISVEKLRSLLGDYINLSCNPSKDDQHQLKIQRIVLDLKEMILLDPKNVTTAIGQAFIIQRPEQMRDLQGFEYNRENPWTIPPIWKRFWKGVIHMLQECAVVGNIVMQMSEGVSTSDDVFFKVQYAAWLVYLLGILRKTGRLLSYQHLLLVAENMLRMKTYYTRETFETILDSMHPFLSDDHRRDLLGTWDNDNSDETLRVDETGIMEDQEVEDGHCALVAMKKSIGLVDGQTKENLDLRCNYYKQ